jgi:hypothetical protein
MKPTRLAFALSMLGVLSACGGAGTQGEVIAGNPTVINQRLDWVTTMQGERVSVDGYIWMSDTEDDNGTVNLALDTAPRGGGTTLLSFNVDRGTGANEVFLSTALASRTAYGVDTYNVDIAAARFTDNAGTQHPWTQRVRLSGTVEYVESFQGGYSKIPGSGGHDMYMWKLTDVRLDPAPGG